MPWTPLQDRLHQLPLILAGPILRRTEAAAVTVWLALRQSCDVTLAIYSTQAGQGVHLDQLQGKATRHTVAVGQHLHLIAVTIYLPPAQTLQSGQIYAYDLGFQLDDQSAPLTLQEALHSPHAPPVSISYFDHRLPTFLLPPQSINELKLIHGSCRKTHGGGIDALPVLDDLLANTARLLAERPHQLFFTGDQIYGDDVVDPWLLALTDAGNTLLGWDETLPLDEHPAPAIPALKPQHLPPGERAGIAEQMAGLTAGLSNKPDLLNSHLLSFGEYCTAYLFAWSPVLWPEHFPEHPNRYTPAHVKKDRQAAQIWDQEVAALNRFHRPLWKVRRVLANIPTYMIFDDHDVSDDWYLNRAWCERVLSKPLGRRIVQNGLMAYALCQGWGNTPAQFEPGTSGAALLQAVEIWSASQGTDADAQQQLARRLGLPATTPAGLPQFDYDRDTWVLNHAPDALQWHYKIESACHEIIVLDTRTWRGYGAADDTLKPPMLLCPSAFERQIRQPLRQTQQRNRLTLVIAPTNLVHLQIIDWVQEWSLKQRKVFSHDVGDAWNLNERAFAALLAVLFETRDRVVILSGDIHYSCAARLSYWSNLHESPRDQVLVQLTSSAFKNAELKTQIAQTKLKSLLPEASRECVGWYDSPELWEAQPASGKSDWRKLPPDLELPVLHQQSVRRGDRAAWKLAAADLDSLPDWQYRVDWVQRQSARPVVWGKLNWLTIYQPQLRGWQRLLSWLARLWHNRWLHEGSEVVGASNFGLVQFDGFDAVAEQPTVSQDVYWCPPWYADRIVVSRFTGSLQPEPIKSPFPLMQH